MIREAAQDGGAFYVRNHGIPTPLIQELFALSKEFFALPDEERLRVAAQSPRQGGYRPTSSAEQGGRTNDSYFASALRDESTGADHPVVGVNQWPVRPARLFPAMTQFMTTMADLTDRLLRDIAVGLNVPDDYFESRFDGAAAHLAQLRCYADTKQHLPAHWDPVPMAFIFQDAAGLECRNAAGQWTAFPPVSDTVVCQFGETMARWTNDRYPANVHRVHPPVDGPRYSIVYQLMPRADVCIECLPTCCDERHPARYPPTSFRDFIAPWLEVPHADGKKSRSLEGLFERIEAAWNDSTTSRPAHTCFVNLASSLSEAGLPLELGELARITVAMWAVLSNRGRMPSENEWPEKARSLGDAVGRNWPLIADSMIEGAQLLRRLPGRERLDRDRLALLMTWRLMGRQVLEHQKVPATHHAQREKLDADFVAIAMRWSTASTSSTAKHSDTFPHMLHQLWQDWAAVRSARNLDEAFRVLATRMMSRVA